MACVSTFSVAVASLDPATLVASGEADLAAVDDLRDALRRLETEGSGDVLVDFRAVTFVDSSALGVLATSRRRLDEAGRGMQLVTTTPQVIRLLEVTNLDQYIPVVDTVPEQG